MDHDLRPRYPGEWLGLSSLVSAASIALYYAFLAALPACGPPRNTRLGQVYFVVPFAIVFVGELILIGIGRLRTWGTSRILGALLVALAMTPAGDVVVWLHFFVVGRCGE